MTGHLPPIVTIRIGFIMGKKMPNLGVGMIIIHILAFLMAKKTLKITELKKKIII